MCGIAGVLDPHSETPADQLQAVTSAMTDALRHRGPDDRGVWVDAAHGVALGNRRLAIIDISPTGHQPMQSGNGRLTMVFNGEVYNHRALRAELEREGRSFRGGSDTEVLLAAIERWGLRPALQRCNGMFALALWDRSTRRLHLARDRMGEKPLYYGMAGRVLAFGSELAALRAHPDFTPLIDRGAVAAYLRFTYVPCPHSIYAGVSKLPPGTILTVDQGRPTPAPSAYWSLHEAAERGAAEASANGSPHDEVEQLRTLLIDAVRLRMESDVPLGAFLSGGVDSSAVVALMQQARPDRVVRTFTISMPEAGFDESVEAASVARHLGTDHTAVALASSDAMDAVHRLPDIYDEPFADPSGLATVLVSQVARRTVTVALSGDGGDELFGGYNRYVLSRSVWRWIRHLPPSVRSTAARALLAVPPARWDELFAGLGRLLTPRLRLRQPGAKAQKLAQLLEASDGRELYRSLVSSWSDPSGLVGTREPTTVLDDPGRWPGLAGITEQMMFLDMSTALPDGMLTKVDRASMSASLEARVPFLDHRVVEHSLGLPLRLKIREGRGKWVLRRVLDRYVPRELVDRPKMGFDPPVGTWLRGPLRPWAEELFDPRRLADEGWFDPAPIRARWSDHLEGRRDWTYSLWTVLMFQAWLDRR